MFSKIGPVWPLCSPCNVFFTPQHKQEPEEEIEAIYFVPNISKLGLILAFGRFTDKTSVFTGIFQNVRCLVGV